MEPNKKDELEDKTPEEKTDELKPEEQDEIAGGSWGTIRSFD